MGVLKFKVKGIEVEFSGDVQEIDHVINKLVNEEYSSHTVNIIEPYELMGKKITEIKDRMPSYKKVMDYILSKPDYAHSLIELQELFIGKKISLRPPYRSLWWQFHSRVRLAQERIEREKEGKFVGEWKLLPDGHKHRVYRFEKLKPEFELREAPQWITIGEKPR